ncbi:tumor necrosis factor ligand superfamily member 6 [Mugil cephalus]|uniref:tumor necrosis factor ligand superfamily member 6 n=1 Tax=Mugil cephalus TaxID=48193 RepID=UPI001FB69FEF|nr:tumor necrosis factor ligand superfamily member 6 [Mugil cephalus]
MWQQHLPTTNTLCATETAASLFTNIVPQAWGRGVVGGEYHDSGSPFKTEVLRQVYTTFAQRRQTHARTVAHHSRTCTMSYDQSYPIPQVFLVDGGGGPQHSAQPPGLIPCWSFPPAVERSRSHEKSRGCMGISPGGAMIVLLLFLLVFAALGFEAIQISNIQKELADRTQVEAVEFNAPEKQIGLPEPGLIEEDKKDRPAAHVIGRIETVDVRKTLRWDSKTGRAFTSGGVVYQAEDGALRVNETGLYHIYSRVELIFRDCSYSSSFEHNVFVRRTGHLKPVTLMEAHRTGFCSERKNRPWTTENYLGSTQLLQRNDSVLVNVSHPQLLSHSHFGNFFGLYKI